ncbi:MAG: hypothetical protein Q8W44_09060 [Candidatus Palauibacterales bacterium]|nr:hypothetical protein [Candidatus Palauibacterales bacterium]
MALRRLRDWKWLLPLLAVLALLAFLGRRHLVPGSGAGPPARPGDGPTLRPEQAAAHVGETATVCGTVAEATYVPEVDGRPTFLNFGAPNPDQAFTAVIWGERRGRFDAPPERTYRRARICVAGRITEHEGVPQIEVRGPGQIRIE